MSILGNVKPRPWPASLLDDPDLEAAVNLLVGVPQEQLDRAREAQLASQAMQNVRAQQEAYEQSLQQYLGHNTTPYYAASAQVPQPHTPRQSIAPLISVSIGHEKLQERIRELVRQLPISIAGRIRSCSYYEADPDEAARFVVTFAGNNRSLTFYDVDEFPSAEHIGRIAFECP